MYATHTTQSLHHANRQPQLANQIFTNGLWFGQQSHAQPIPANKAQYGLFCLAVFMLKGNIEAYTVLLNILRSVVLCRYFYL